MTRPWTPHEVRDGKKILHVKRCCEQCGREIGDVNEQELEAAVAGRRLPDVRDECGCPHVIEQLALFAQACDAREWGGAVDGVFHPTWEEIDPAGREQYIADATRTVRAMVTLGWAPRREDAS